MSILTILTLIAIAVTLILVLSNQPVSQKWINVLLLIIALLLVLNGVNTGWRLN